MLEPLTALDWLSEQFTTTNQRLLVTVVTAGFSLAVLLSSQAFHRHLNERLKPLHADVLTTVVLIVTFVLSMATILGVWGQTGAIRELYERQDLGEEFVARVIVSFVILVSAYIVVRFVRRLLRELFESSSAVTRHQHEVAHRLAQVVLWTTALVVILSVWTDDLGGLLVGAGFLGIVLGMAARQTLGSMIAGFVLMFSRPFEVGDWIEIDEREGIVTDISIVNTRIQTFDGEYVVVPNDVVGSSLVTNRSKHGRLRVEIEVGVDYEADVERARELALEAIDDVPEAQAVPEPGVVTKSFDDSAVVLGVRFWVDEPTASTCTRARTTAIGAIKDAFDEHGVKIPYPQRELSGRSGTDVQLSDDGARGGDDRWAPDERASAGNDEDRNGEPSPPPMDRT